MSCQITIRFSTLYEVVCPWRGRLPGTLQQVFIKGKGGPAVAANKMYNT